ncbi:hypothetical protein I3843_09G048300 [Carya illinoinensis]|uniref:VQ domain-containing protein n=1 Tax=Carya illinoinensis TaxID=32201 RepID=A0A8T1PJ19_CARIL|nr:sigma factor binding protein 1, chloroplastic-like [Carya illinoinensis]KAG2687358.1 hypothetical protein I3760_09G047800 [Carya illinoinensis]KAG2687359.1 hypothetical protein I3760_09G047800 [Carya illinoinensis]KAG6641071.1 hypothetical protein CIPAW_09G047800 [Carya illinoinensis]KAG6641072.1 hypothetical protein CIPAW_09G047800 [Carya illinoinensis]KAG6694426.1 hypothetical protein I3842_09G048000 [Carya illinoinensis]
MDNNLPISVHQRKAVKKTKSKKNMPIKVVYISNPMKVKTSASEFRALVQQLTGQDAEYPVPAKFLCTDNDVGGVQTVPGPVMKAGGDDYSPEAPVVDLGPEQTESSGYQFNPYDDDDDVFTPLQMIENLPAAGGSFFPSSVFYESPQVDVV